MGVLAGSFNPVTVAHLALARSARAQVEEVLLVVPRTFPHRSYSGASAAERLRMLCAAAEGEPGLSVAESEGGLFVEIAAECRAAYGAGIRPVFICGRDAAERIAHGEAWEHLVPGRGCAPGA